MCWVVANCMLESYLEDTSNLCIYDGICFGLLKTAFVVVYTVSRFLLQAFGIPFAT